MRWRKPYYNDKREIKRFLFLPRCIRKEVRWLELVSIIQFWNGREWKDFKFWDGKK